MKSAPLFEINLSGNIWLASDIHLGAEIPATADAFYNFLARARQEADNLILAGDIFDSWVGDDDAIKKPAPWLHKAILELKETANSINLFIMPGNRDFLIGKKLINYLDAIYLPSPSKIITNQAQFLLAHGDEYCTDDINYQKFRQLVHNRFVQAIFLALPLNTRRKIAAYARGKSKLARGNKTQAIMDVNQSALTNALLKANTNVIIHGHTHRPAVHNLLVNNNPATRYVLSDWDMDKDNRNGWISINDNEINVHSLITES